MAMPILAALAAGDSLLDSNTLGRIAGEWKDRARTSKDVGAQTSAVLGRISITPTEQEARDAARAQHERSGKSAGNGSLMRSCPVSLGFLGENKEPHLVEASAGIADLTHRESDNADACAIWNLAIRHAILTGELDVASQVQFIPVDRRDRWSEIIARATGAHPLEFAAQNGWVVAAFQAALAAITSTTNLVSALELVIRAGADTVAAITGSLAGALYGAQQVPSRWRSPIHGWPGLNAIDLEAKAAQAVGRAPA